MSLGAGLPDVLRLSTEQVDTVRFVLEEHALEPPQHPLYPDANANPRTGDPAAISSNGDLGDEAPPPAYPEIADELLIPAASLHGLFYALIAALQQGPGQQELRSAGASAASLFAGGAPPPVCGESIDLASHTVATSLWLVRTLRYFELPADVVASEGMGTRSRKKRAARGPPRRADQASPPLPRPDSAIGMYAGRAQSSAGSNVGSNNRSAAKLTQGDARDPTATACRFDLTLDELDAALEGSEVFDGRLFLFCIDSRNGSLRSGYERKGAPAPEWLDRCLSAAINGDGAAVQAPQAPSGGDATRRHSVAESAASQTGSAVSGKPKAPAQQLSGAEAARQLRLALKPNIPVATRAVQVAMARRFTEAQVDKVVKGLVEVCFAATAATSADATKASVVSWIEPFRAHARDALRVPEAAIDELVFFFNFALRSRIQRGDIVGWARAFTTYLPPCLSFRNAFTVDIARMWWAVPLDEAGVDAVFHFLVDAAVNVAGRGAASFVDMTGRLAAMTASSDEGASGIHVLAADATVLESTLVRSIVGQSKEGQGFFFAPYTVERLAVDLKHRLESFAVSLSGLAPEDRDSLRPLAAAAPAVHQELVRLVVHSLLLEPFVPAELTTRPMLAQRLLGMAECLKASALTAAPHSVATSVFPEKRRSQLDPGCVFARAPLVGVKRPLHCYPDILALQLAIGGNDRADAPPPLGESDAPRALPAALVFRLAFGHCDVPKLAALAAAAEDEAADEIERGAPRSETTQLPIGEGVTGSVATLDRLRRSSSMAVLAMRCPPPPLGILAATRTLCSVTPSSQCRKAAQVFEQLAYTFEHGPCDAGIWGVDTDLQSSLAWVREMASAAGDAAEVVGTGARSPFYDAPMVFQSLARAAFLAAAGVGGLALADIAAAAGATASGPNRGISPTQAAASPARTLTSSGGNVAGVSPAKSAAGGLAGGSASTVLSGLSPRPPSAAKRPGSANRAAVPGKHFDEALVTEHVGPPLPAITMDDVTDFKQVRAAADGEHADDAESNGSDGQSPIDDVGAAAVPVAAPMGSAPDVGSTRSLTPSRVASQPSFMPSPPPLAPPSGTRRRSVAPLEVADLGRSATPGFSVASFASTASPTKVRGRVRKSAMHRFASARAALLLDAMRYLRDFFTRAQFGIGTSFARGLVGKQVAPIAVDAVQAASRRAHSDGGGAVLRYAFGLGRAEAAIAVRALCEEILRPTRPWAVDGRVICDEVVRTLDIRETAAADDDADTPFASKREVPRAHREGQFAVEEAHVAVAAVVARNDPLLARVIPELRAATWVLLAELAPIRPAPEAPPSGDPFAAAEHTCAADAEEAAEGIAQAIEGLADPSPRRGRSRSRAMSSVAFVDMPRRHTVHSAIAHSPTGRIAPPKRAAEAPADEGAGPAVIHTRAAECSGLNDETAALVQREAGITGFGDLTDAKYAVPMIEAAYDRLRDVNGYVPLSTVLAELEGSTALAAGPKTVRESLLKSARDSSRLAFQDLSEYCQSPSPWVRQMKEIFGPPDYFQRQEPYAIVAYADYCRIQLQLASL